MAMDRNDHARPCNFAGTQDRRADRRYPAACRIARLKRGTNIGLAQIRNISDSGMMLATDMTLGPGDAIEVILSADMILAGKIVWAHHDRRGVAFVDAQNAEEILAILMHEEKLETHRAQRLPIDAEAVLLTRHQAYAIDLVDISANGAGFRTSHKLEAGQVVELLLPGDDMRRTAAIRWTKGDRGGLWFSIPLDSNSLARARGKGRTH